MILKPYTGKYPEAQTSAETKAANLAGGNLMSRQAAAVLRVLVDEIEDLRGEVSRLRLEHTTERRRW